MSQRSIRRAQQRRLDAERRRETLKRRRASVATGAAIGAAALFAPSAHAAGFEVTSLGDGAANACDSDCTLRDAVTLANANTELDTITFESGLTGTIRLTEGEIGLGSTYALTLDGPGRDVLSVSGDADDNGPDAGDSRIFAITDTGPVTISGLTMTEGYPGADNGGAIRATGGTPTIEDSAITDSRTTSGTGGGIFSQGTITITRTNVTGNAAQASGGGIGFEAGDPDDLLTVSGSTISGNSGTSGGGLDLVGYASVDDTEISGNDATAGDGGGIRTITQLDVTGSTLSGNTSTGVGGALSQSGPYAPLDISGSEISGNSAALGGGLDIAPTSLKYGSSPAARTIGATTISGNHATAGDGGGIRVVTLNPGDQLTISRTTISGNDTTAGGGSGGGVMFGGLGTPAPIRGAFDLIDSTISGNTAGTGAGVSVGEAGAPPALCECGSIEFDNSTIASNTATSSGGGIYLAAYNDPDPPYAPTSATIPLTSTIVSDNAASGAPQDLDRADSSTGGGFDLAFTLVETPGDAPVTQSPAGTNFLGTDPQLGPLADNGGPTHTHLPAQASPVIDRGDAPARLGTDQRGEQRTVDGDPANASGGDGTDIGSVEILDPPASPKPEPEPTPTQPTPTPEPPPAKPPKNNPPQAFIKTNGLRAKQATGRRATGIATDDSKVEKVQVALVYKSGGNCRDLLASGRFSTAHRCGGPRVFIDAQGTEKWTFAVSRRLRRGYYVIYARATDDAGRTQSSFGTKSRRPFRVRSR